MITNSKRIDAFGKQRDYSRIPLPRLMKIAKQQLEESNTVAAQHTAKLILKELNAQQDHYRTFAQHILAKSPKIPRHTGHNNDS